MTIASYSTSLGVVRMLLLAVVATIVVLLLPRTTSALQINSPTNLRFPDKNSNAAARSEGGRRSKLMAWSMPNPAKSSLGRTLSSPTWYNEHNPLAHQATYHDSSPLEFTFVALGDDWPSMEEEEASEATAVVVENSTRRRRNPLRRAAAALRARRERRRR